MFGTGWIARASQFAFGCGVVLPLLINGASADEGGGVTVIIIPVGLIIVFIKILLIVACKLILKTRSEETSSNTAHPPPSVPSGRYCGSRSLESSADRESIEYILNFSSDGTVTGTMQTSDGEPTDRVKGSYEPETKMFHWIETNIGEMEVNPFLEKLAELSDPEYQGPERMTAVTVKVIDSGGVGDTDSVALIGEYANISGPRGDVRLIYKPDTEARVVGAPPSDSVTIPIAPLSIERAKSFDSRQSNVEPMLERESI